MKTTLLIQLGAPTSDCTCQEGKEAPVSIEDRVRHAIDLVDSGYCSDVEWIMLNKFLRSLYNKKQTPRVKNLIGMIEPVLAKYGYHKVTAEG
jgi:hypothetical protein